MSVLKVVYTCGAMDIPIHCLARTAEIRIQPVAVSRSRSVSQAQVVGLDSVPRSVILTRQKQTKALFALNLQLLRIGSFKAV